MHKNREIKSFVLRGGRMSLQQRQVLSVFWPKFGISVAENEQLDLAAIFNKTNPKVIFEIGFGNGVTLADMAEKNPEYSFLGVEVYTTGISNLLLLIEEKNLTNIRIIQHDAVAVLRNNIKDHALHKVQIFFPDPWPKLRHRKRRLVNPLFVELLTSKIISGGILHMATDWEDYAIQMLNVVSSNSHFTNSAGLGNFSSDKLGRSETKFERRGARLGHGVWDLVFCLSDR
jgi:tRNA (guanine-N7-)-methyltransferase